MNAGTTASVHQITQALKTCLHKLEKYSTLFTCEISNIDFSERVGASTSDVRLGRVECHVVHRLIELASMQSQILNARLRVQVPQPHRRIVTCKKFTHDTARLNAFTLLALRGLLDDNRYNPLGSIARLVTASW